MLVEAAISLVVLLHLAYLVYAVLGGFLGVVGTRWLWPHLVSSAWCITVTATVVTCPLTGLEKDLIRLAGRTPYNGTFIDQYLEGVVYPDGYDAHVWFGGATVVLSSYAIVLGKHLRGRSPTTAPEPMHSDAC